MATKCVLNKSTMTNIANAIRTKGGTSASLLPSAMPAAINAIQTDDDAWLHIDEKEYTGTDLILYIDIPYDGFEFYHYVSSFSNTYPMMCDWGDGSEHLHLVEGSEIKKTHIYNIGRYVLRIYPSSQNVNCKTGYFRYGWGGIFYSGVYNVPTDGVSATVKKLCVGTRYNQGYSSQLGGMLNLKYLLCANTYPVDSGYNAFGNCNVSVYANLNSLGSTKSQDANNVKNYPEDGQFYLNGAKDVYANYQFHRNNAFRFARCLHKIHLGPLTESFGANALNYTTALDTFICEATTPPTTTDGTSLGSWYTNKGLSVQVPASSISSYLIAPNWCKFGSAIMPIDATAEQKGAAANGEYMAKFADGVITAGAAFDAPTAESATTITWNSSPFNATQISAIETLMSSKNYTMAWR